MFDLAQHVAVVTGGSSGIGLATVKLLARAGAAVAFCGRNEARLQQALVEVQQAYPQAHLLALPCDVLNPAEVQAFTQAVQQRLGTVNILVNNAGQGRVSTFANTDDAAWLEELQLKFFSVIHPCRALIPQLAQSANAAIVCVNSLLAKQPEPHMVATSAARAGVLSLVRSLATELAPQRIRVNGILIGLVESGQWRRRYAERAKPEQSWEAWVAQLAQEKHIPLGRLGLPEEAAQAIAFLASPLSSYTTGSHIDVSGGLSRHV